MTSPNHLLDLIADHPKISQGVAGTTTGVSAAVKYVEQTQVDKLPTEMASFIGICIGIIASLVVIYANVRKIRHESKMNKLDLELKELMVQKQRNEERREQGLPMRRAGD